MQYHHFQRRSFSNILGSSLIFALLGTSSLAQGIEIAPAGSPGTAVVQPVNPGQDDQIAIGTDSGAGGPVRNATAGGLSGIAIGAGAQAGVDATDGNVSIGDYATSVGGYGMAIGTGAYSEGVAIGNNAHANDEDVAIGAGALVNGTTDHTTGSGGASTGQSVAIGENAGARATTGQSTILGFGAGVDSSGTNNTFSGFVSGTGATGNENTYSGSQSGLQSNGNQNTFSGVLSGALARGDGNVAFGSTAGAAVVGSNNVSIGNNAGTIATLLAPTPSTYSNAVSIGNQADALTDDAISIGNTSTVTGRGSVAIGDNNTVEGRNTFVLGGGITSDNTFNGSVILGYGSSTAGSAPVVQTVTSATVGAVDYGDFVGQVSDPGKFVSVGAAGDERKVTNVAAGEITATSTEAINGSQLYAVASQGITFQTDSGSTSPTQLGSTIEIIGDSANQIQVSVTPDGKIQIAISDQPQFGNVQINADGTGKITGVTDGDVSAGSTDAVNGSQLAAVAQGATWNLGVNGDAGVQVTPTANRVNLVQGENIVIKRGQSGSNNIVISTAPNLSADSVTINNGGPVLSSAGLDMRGQSITNVRPGRISPNSMDAVNGSQLYGFQNQVAANRAEANAGIASSMALGQIRYDDRPGKLSAGFGLGRYGGQMGYAIGVGFTSESRLWRFSGGVTYAPGTENLGAAASATYTFN